jgi:hypothetical protein
MTPEKWTAADLLSKLYYQYQHKTMSNAVVPEASIGEFGAYSNERSVRRIDALVMFLDKRWAVEIKVSRSDLRNEVANPHKQTLWRDHTHSFYFLVTPELLEYALEIVPKQFGVMSPYGSYLKVFRRSKRNPAPLDLPYTTLLRLGAAYGKSYREVKRWSEFPPST